MCLIVFAWQSHPDYPLVVAANRDEFYRRPARTAHWRKADRTEILAGLDEEAGGTWMAISATGRFAALTNHRDPAAMRRNAPSRGALVPHFLSHSRSTEESFAELASTAHHFNGFNLLLFDGEALGVFESRTQRGTLLSPGLYALSNASLSSPWPKQQRARTRLASGLAELPALDSLFDMLRDDRPAPDATLPVTGVGLEWERMLSSAFIRAPGYGTRCSSVALIGRDRKITFEERSWNDVGRRIATVREHFAAIGASTRKQ